MPVEEVEIETPIAVAKAKRIAGKDGRCSHTRAGGMVTAWS